MAKEKNSKDKNNKKEKKEDKEEKEKEEEEEMEEESKDEGEEVVKFPEAEEEFNFQLDTTAHDKATMALESGQKTPELNLEGFLQDVNIEKKEKKEKERKPQDLYSATEDTGYITRKVDESWEQQQMREVRETIKPQVILEETRHAPRLGWKPITEETHEFKEITKYEEKYEKIGGDAHRPGFAREGIDKQNIKKYKAIKR